MTVAIELEGKPYSPILDVQGNIRQLIDLHSKSPEVRYEYTAFGESLINANQPDLNPWRYASKRFDPELGILYFGNRFYDPSTARWLSEDPAGYVDSSNLYQYVFNNPFRYKDPDGKFVTFIPLFYWGATITFSSLAVIGECVLTSVAAVYAAYKGAECVSKIIEGIYAPDRDLPTKDGAPIQDENAEGPNTQLGTRDGSKGKYVKAREFGNDGIPVKTIEFTDHGRSDHPCPHQHRYEENETGGTRNHLDPEPLDGWNYNK